MKKDYSFQVFFLLLFVLIVSSIHSFSIKTLEKSESFNSNTNSVSTSSLNENQNLNSNKITNKNSEKLLKTKISASGSISFRGKSKSSLILNSKEKAKPTLPEGFTSWYEGWVNYYKYNNSTEIERPTYFFINKKYWGQRKPVEDLAKEDNNGKLIIPDKNSFYLVLGEKSLHIYSNRDDPFMSQVDHLSYDHIEAIPTDKKYDGGVKDMFSFSIGHCIMVKASLKLESSSQSTPERWIFCLKDLQRKNKLLHALINAKLFIQNQNGEIVSSDSINAQNAANNLADFLTTKRKENKEKDIKKSEKAEDGYWVTLQDWTECSLKCGGGKSFKQRMCVPPKNGGRECIGDEVEEKECNSQPCPGVTTFVKQQEENKPVINNPVVKIGSFSQRPQRYIKCVIKENDAFVEQLNEIGTIQSLPSRVVMNDKTFSIRKSDQYQDLIDSFDLKDSDVVADKAFCCFSVSDKFKSRKVCGFDKDCGTPDKNEWVVNWIKDFKLFRDQCYNGFEESLLDGDDEKLLNNKAKNKMKQVNLEIAKSKQLSAKEEMVNEQTNQLREGLVKTQETGFEAIEKELDIENMLKEEEKQKEQDDIKGLQEKLSVESEKLKCVKESIQEKELDNEFIEQQHQVESDVKQIKKEFTEKIVKKRENLKNLLEKMRKKSKMDKSKLESEIKSLRNKISAGIMIANKNGSIDTCRDGKVDKDKRVKYCDSNFVDDFVNNSDCKLDDEFCYLCCETEFGNSHMDKREKCYSMCDIKEEPVKLAPVDRWTWKQNK